MKSFLAWLYHWITVVGAVLVGGASITLEVIDTLALSDVASFLPPEKALKIVTGVAVLKWACVLVKTVHVKMTGAV